MPPDERTAVHAATSTLEVQPWAVPMELDEIGRQASDWLRRQLETAGDTPGNLLHIEEGGNKSPQVCPRIQAVLYYDDGGTLFANREGCGRLDCEVCGPRIRGEIIDRIEPATVHRVIDEVSEDEWTSYRATWECHGCKQRDQDRTSHRDPKDRRRKCGQVWDQVEIPQPGPTRKLLKAAGAEWYQVPTIGDMRVVYLLAPVEGFNTVPVPKGDVIEALEMRDPEDNRKARASLGFPMAKSRAAAGMARKRARDRGEPIPDGLRRIGKFNATLPLADMQERAGRRNVETVPVEPDEWTIEGMAVRGGWDVAANRPATTAVAWWCWDIGAEPDRRFAGQLSADDPKQRQPVPRQLPRHLQRAGRTVAA